MIPDCRNDGRWAGRIPLFLMAVHRNARLHVQRFKIMKLHQRYSGNFGGEGRFGQGRRGGGPDG